MRNNTLIRSILILILTCFYVFTASCTTVQKSTESPNIVSVSPDDTVAAARQATVDALSSLPSGFTVPEVYYDTPDFARLEGWFDVNAYFSVLNHLSLQPGYILDYVHHNNGSGAQPYLYARKIDSKPFNTLDELNNAYIDKAIDHTYDYLAYVQTDDTEESYFQYITLHIMGGQFYL